MAAMDRAWPCVVALALAGACFTDDPQGHGSSASTGSATESSTTSGSSAAETTGTTTTTTGDATGTSTTAESTTTGETGEVTTTTTTSGGLPNPLVFPPTAAACVLLANSETPYGGPGECAEASEAHNGTGTMALLVAAKQVPDAGGREGRIVLSFPIPPEVADVTVTKAALSMVIADGAVAGGLAGELYRISPFDDMSLEQASPDALELLEAVPEDLAPVGGTVVRAIPVEHVIAGETLSLGIWPTSSDGIIIRDNTWEAERPFLSLTFE